MYELLGVAYKQRSKILSCVNNNERRGSDDWRDTEIANETDTVSRAVALTILSYQIVRGNAVGTSRTQGLKYSSFNNHECLRGPAIEDALYFTKYGHGHCTI
jgi:hypothetical protein